MSEDDVPAWVGRDGEEDIQVYSSTLEYLSNQVTFSFFERLNKGDLPDTMENFGWEEDSLYNIYECLLPWEFIE